MVLEPVPVPVNRAYSGIIIIKRNIESQKIPLRLRATSTIRKNDTTLCAGGPFYRGRSIRKKYSHRPHKKEYRRVNETGGAFGAARKASGAELDGR